MSDSLFSNKSQETRDDEKLNVRIEYPWGDKIFPDAMKVRLSGNVEYPGWNIKRLIVRGKNCELLEDL